MKMQTATYSIKNDSVHSTDKLADLDSLDSMAKKRINTQGRAYGGANRNAIEV